MMGMTSKICAWILVLPLPGILTGRALLLMLGSSLIIAPSIMKTTHRLVVIAI